MTAGITQLELDDLWDFDDAGKSEAQLRAALERASEPIRIAELTTQVARALGLQDRFAEADELLESIPNPQGVVAVRVYLERGRVRTSSDRLADAIPLFEAALELATIEHLDFLEADAAHMLVIAEPARAEHWTARGLEPVVRTTDARTKRWAFSLHNNLGWHLFDDGNPVAALAEFELAAHAAAEYGTERQQELAQQAIDEVRKDIVS